MAALGVLMGQLCCIIKLLYSLLHSKRAPAWLAVTATEHPANAAPAQGAGQCST